jgi:DnaJ-class molecular chaperone
MAICESCNGTGVNIHKTVHMRLTGMIGKGEKVRCWSCNGNGNDDPNGIYEGKGNRNGRNRQDHSV